MKILERISSIADDALMDTSPKEFAERLYERAWCYAVDLYDPIGWEISPVTPDVYEERLIFYLRRRSWAEWYFGTVTVARQVVLLGNGHPDVSLRLARQIQDEVRHHAAFATASRKLGGEWRVERFPEPPNLVSMRNAQEAAGSAGELAAANQLGGEVVLLIHGQTEGNVLSSLVPESIQSLLEDIETDEPAHVELGRELVALHATGPKERRAMAAVQERFLNALGPQHTAELEQLGARRQRPLPEFM